MRMREVTVTLGGTVYRVRQLPMRAEAEWRRLLQARLAPLLGLIANFQQIEFNTPADFAAFLQGLAPLLLDAPDLMLALLYDYSPDLRAHADAIEESAYSDEVMEALKAVMGLAYPFARDLVGAMRAAGQAAMQSGAAKPASATTSPS